MRRIVYSLALFFALAILVDGKSLNVEKDEEDDAREYINNLDKVAGIEVNLATLAEWDYASNITDYNEELRLNASLNLARLTKLYWEETIKYNWTTYQDQDLKRKFSKYAFLGKAALPAAKYEEFQKSISEMQTNYATAKICDFFNTSKCDLSLEPDIEEIFANSQNAEQLKHTWLEWHNEAGKKAKNAFKEYVRLSNEAAVLNGFNDNAEVWLREYEQDDFEEEMDELLEQMKPLYRQIHAYVRKQLFNQYGPTVVNRRGPIPAHLLGNVWAQTWGNLESFTRPYPNKPAIDVTENMTQQGYTPVKMFEMADEFFQSLNLTGMPEKFWQNSILEKPNDGRELICHASAWDFYDSQDFRIKQCTVVTQSQFETAHHEMGHIEYFLQYKDQPTIYKTGANPGFHEAVGDVISLSVSSPKHLIKIGLLTEGLDDDETEMNNLYSKGINKIVFLPFAYLLDKYRYSIFRGETTPDNYNCHFWKMREDLQGLEPPLKRTEDDFDAAAKYHISADVEYLRYYVSFIIQFQFHRSLCEKAGQYEPGNEALKLTDCDIYQSTEAGNAMGEMLSLGASRPWPDAMEIVTGQRKMDAGAILEYFRPLQRWLEAENERTGELIGWEKSTVEYCTDDQIAQMESAKTNK